MNGGVPLAHDGAAGTRRLERFAWAGLITAVVLIVAALAIPPLTGWEVWANHFPPLHARWRPHIGLGTVPALAIAFIAIRWGTDAAARLSWGRLLIVAFGVGALWLFSLALVDGPSGLGKILEHSSEYLQVARTITDIPALLSEYISRIPRDSENHWRIHLAGHPPGAVLFFWALAKLGLGSWLGAGIAVLLIGATTPIAVLITLRRLGAEGAARKAAPFLVFGPAAIWVAVSADGMFAAVAAWGLCLLALAATAGASGRHHWWTAALWGVGAGALLGYCMLLSYGLPLLGVLAVAVLVVARCWWPLPWAAGAALAVVLAFAAGGFAWWDAYPVLVERYWAGIATRRPAGYWMWGNLAALAISAGPIVGAGLGATFAGLRRARTWTTEHRAVVLIVMAAALSIALADVSQMSKAEVERIWLPFVPWLLVGTALLPERWRRWGLAGQLGFAIVVQHLLFTTW